MNQASKEQIQISECRDQSKLEAFLRRNTAWHLYALADLDEPFWPDTRWFVATVHGEIQGAVILIGALSAPILYGICEPNDSFVRAIIKSIEVLLPHRFFAHVGLGVLCDLHQWDFCSEGAAVKMVLSNAAKCSATVLKSTETEADYEVLKEFYDLWAYGEDNESRFFEAYMPKMSPYRVLRQGGRIISAAGVHVASKKYQVAALGNIATSPEMRGRGYGTMVTSALVHDLKPHFADIGLNVLEANGTARHCYEKLGFVTRLRYEEGLVTRRNTPNPQ